MKKIILGAIGLFILIGIIGAAGGNKTEKVGENTPSGSSGSQAKTEEQKYKVGEQIKMGDIVLTVNKMEKSTGGQYTKPSEGNVWVNLNLTLENTGSDQEYITTLGQMYLIDKDGNQYQTAVTNKTMENINNSLDGAIVAKAKKTGWVGFEATKTATGLVFRYNASFWNDKAILVTLE